MLPEGCPQGVCGGIDLGADCGEFGVLALCDKDPAFLPPLGKGELAVVGEAGGDDGDLVEFDAPAGFNWVDPERFDAPVWEPVCVVGVFVGEVGVGDAELFAGWEGAAGEEEEDEGEEGAEEAGGGEGQELRVGLEGGEDGVEFRAEEGVELRVECGRDVVAAELVVHLCAVWGV